MYIITADDEDGASEADYENGEVEATMDEDAGSWETASHADTQVGVFVQMLLHITLN